MRVSQIWGVCCHLQSKTHFLSAPSFSVTPAVTEQSLFNQTVELSISRGLVIYERSERWQIPNLWIETGQWSWQPFSEIWTQLLLIVLCCHESWRAFTILNDCKVWENVCLRLFRFIIPEWFQIQLMQPEIFKLSTRIHNPVASWQWALYWVLEVGWRNALLIRPLHNEAHSWYMELNG